MNQMEIFKNPEFGTIRAVEIDGEPWLVGKDVALALGYKNPQEAIRNHVDTEDKGVSEFLTPGGMQKLPVINESGLYSLVLSSKLPKAKQFRRWVTSEVLPTIRKHGAYITREKLWEVATSPEAMMKLCSDLLAEREKNVALRKENAMLESKAAFYDLFIDLKHSTNLRTTAKELVVPERRFVRFLLEQRFVYRAPSGNVLPYERSLLAEKLWHLYHDFSDKARDSGYLSCLSGIQRTGFPEETAWLAEQLNRPEFRQTLAEEYAAFWTAYQQDRELLRFHYHKPREIWENLKDLSLPRTTFTSQLTEVPAVKQFITEDEIDAAITGGSSFAGGKGRIYAFFMENHSDKEKVRFLKDEYGIGGRSHALSGATHSGEDHDGKGLHYKKQDCQDVHLNWEKVAKRITSLVQKGRYLTEQEQAE